MPGTQQMTMTPANILKYQNDLVRTGLGLPLGIAKKIAIGPAAGYTPPANDPFIKMYGRLIDFRDRGLRLMHSPDRSMILVANPMITRDGYVGLPDVPVPEWIAPPKTEEEITGREVVDSVTGARHREPVFSDHAAPMIPQRLEDRTNELLEGTNFLVFAPVLSVAFQPEYQGDTIGTVWVIDCFHNPADRTTPTLLVDRKTGETHFFGGLYDIKRAVGEG